MTSEVKPAVARRIYCKFGKDTMIRAASSSQQVTSHIQGIANSKSRYHDDSGATEVEMRILSSRLFLVTYCCSTEKSRTDILPFSGSAVFRSLASHSPLLSLAPQQKERIIVHDGRASPTPWQRQQSNQRRQPNEEHVLLLRMIDGGVFE